MRDMSMEYTRGHTLGKVSQVLLYFLFFSFFFPVRRGCTINLYS